ncbi:MAG: hypothetical protein ACKPKO_58345, partial [Candidatus Fonsibacter sp.]
KWPVSALLEHSSTCRTSMRAKIMGKKRHVPPLSLRYIICCCDAEWRANVMLTHRNVPDTSYKGGFLTRLLKTVSDL